jgi:hypothetical protein
MPSYVNWQNRYQKAQDELFQKQIDGQENWGYTYPKDDTGIELDLRPGSDFSTFLIQQTNKRLEASRSAIEPMHPKWKKMEWTMNSFMPADADDLYTIKKDSRKPVCVVMPTSFINLHTYLAFNTRMFLQKDVIYNLRGYGDPQSMIDAAVMEQCVFMQNMFFDEHLRILTNVRSNYTHGYGVSYTKWSKARGKRTSHVPMSAIAKELAGAHYGVPAEMFKEARTQIEEYVTLYEGGESVPLDPWLFYWDVNTPLSRIQDAEYLGWQYRTNAMDLMMRETDPEESLFNGKAVRIMAQNGKAASRFWGRPDTGRNINVNADGTQSQNVDTAVDVTVHFQRIIPYEWGVGDSKEPEIYTWQIAGDEIVVAFGPLDRDHGQYPVVVTATNCDGFQLIPTAHLFATYGLQQTIDFWMNLIAKAGRKSVNGRMIARTNKVEKDDLLNPEGILYRLTEEALAEDVSLDNYLKFVDAPDYWSKLLPQMQIFAEMAKEAGFTGDIQRGDLSQLPERPGQMGVQAAIQGGGSVLGYLAFKTWHQLIKRAGWQHAHNTRQLMSEKVQLEVTGQLRKRLEVLYPQGPPNMMEVSRDQLSPYFRIVPTPGLNGLQQQMPGLEKMLPMFLQNSNVAADLGNSLPIKEWFLRYAYMNGIEDAADPIPQKPMSDEQVVAEAQAGNIKPVAPAPMPAMEGVQP